MCELSSNGKRSLQRRCRSLDGGQTLDEPSEAAENARLMTHTRPSDPDRHPQPAGPPGRSASAWAGGIRIGLRSIRREPLLGLKRLILPASYWRYAEFRFALQWLPSQAGVRIFDLGSPKDLALMLAADRHAEVVATDILESATSLAERYARAQGIHGSGAGRVHTEQQDGRKLRYESDSFDAAVSISVLEHIPADGDSIAIRELARVTKPGGLIVITVPYDERYRETFVRRGVYERSSDAGQPVFYERHYDRESLERRLIEPSAAKAVALELWGEGSLPMERVLSALGPVRTILSPLEAVLSRHALRRIDGGEGRAMAAFLALQKPATRSADPAI